MFLNQKILIGLPVETKSGLVLGKIRSFEIDSESQTIMKYFVKSRNLVSKLLNEETKELIIHRDQVISIDAEKMVVDDSAVKDVKTIKLLQGIKQDVPALSSTLNISKSHGDF